MRQAVADVEVTLDRRTGKRSRNRRQTPQTPVKTDSTCFEIGTHCRHWRDNFDMNVKLAARKTKHRCRLRTIRGASRAKKITYPGTGNNSQFSYDGLGRCVKIVEVTGGSTTSTKQFIWCGSQRCEVRDGSGNLLNQYFGLGQVNFSGGSDTSYYYTKDHLGSIREMMNSSGTVVYQQSFDPYGQPTVMVSTTAPDFGYAGYYVHQRSGLNLTATRAYSSSLGRFISRDPIEEGGGVNLYAYVSNSPIAFADPSGLKKFCLKAEKNNGTPPPFTPPPAYNGNIPPWQQPPYVPPVIPPDTPNPDWGPGGGGYPTAGQLQKNIAIAEKHPGDYFWFYNQVHAGGPWDYKTQGTAYENYGNFNYGATAAAMGIPLTVALRAAGWAQVSGPKNAQNPAWGNPLGGRPFGDDPRDQAMIRAGYYAYGTTLVTP